MRATTLGFALFLLSGLTASAATVTLTKTVRHYTTDWSPYTSLTGPAEAPVIELNGSEIFEDYHSEGNPGIFAHPTFDEALGPIEWLHIAHDITMTIESSGRGVIVGSFSIHLPGPAHTLIASAGHSRSDGLVTSSSVRSVGIMALAPADFATFQPGRPRRRDLQIYGGANALLAADYDPELYYDPYQQGMDLWREIHVDGILHGALSITAGFGGVPEPPLNFAPPTTVTLPTTVPLPASGLLLGAVLLAGAAMRRRAMGHTNTI